jgi:cupin domain
MCATTSWIAQRTGDTISRHAEPGARTIRRVTAEGLEPATEFAVLAESDLAPDVHSRDFQGFLCGAVGVRSFLSTWPPAAASACTGIRTRRSSSSRRGRATYTVGSTSLEVRAPKIVVVRPGVPHKFINSGDGPLRQVDIHVTERFVTDWLES